MLRARQLDTMRRAGKALELSWDTFIYRVVIERFAYRPLRHRSKLSVLITAIGVSLLLENAGQLIFGANPQPFPEVFPARRLL